MKRVFLMLVAIIFVCIFFQFFNSESVADTRDKYCVGDTLYHLAGNPAALLYSNVLGKGGKKIYLVGGDDKIIIREFYNYDSSSIVGDFHITNLGSLGGFYVKIISSGDDSVLYGFIYIDDFLGLKLTKDSPEQKEEQQKQKEEQQILVDAKRLKERLKELQVKYGTKFGKLIFENQIVLNMNKEMVRESWGSPERINKTVNRYGAHEQWVYTNYYLYFDDGILTTWQSFR